MIVIPKFYPPYDELYGIVLNINKCIDSNDHKGQLIYTKMLEKWINDHPIKELYQEQP